MRRLPEIVSLVVLGILIAFAFSIRMPKECETEELREAIVELGFAMLELKADLEEVQSQRGFVFEPNPDYNAPKGEKPWVLPDVTR